METSRLFVMSGSPHIHTSRTTRGAMWHVVVALMPALIVGFLIFGLSAVAVTATSVAACLVTEMLVTRYMFGRQFSITGGSAVVTGLLLAMSLPSGIPLWIVCIGAVVAIGVGKMAFGGLGCNIFNPAMVGRVFLLLSFPAQMTTWVIPGADGATGATLLSRLKLGEISASSVDYLSTAYGDMAGSFGEVSSIALLAGFVYLLCMRIVTWHAPVAVLSTVALFAALTGADVGVELLSGGLLLGAFFMATDYVTSPMTKTGMVIFGAGIGVITFVIRHWGVYPEGVSFAILIMNGFVPLINRCCKPRKFGERSAVI